MTKRISIDELLWSSFQDDFGKKKYCSVWQAIFHVLEKQCEDTEVAYSFAQDIAEVERYVMQSFFEECESEDVHVYDKRGNELALSELLFSIEQLSSPSYKQTSKVFIEIEDANYYLGQLNQLRLEVVQRYQAASVAYSVLMIQIEKEINQAGPVLKFKKISLASREIDEKLLYEIGKGSLSKWKDILLSDSATLVNNIVGKSVRSQRVDSVQNPQKVIGMMVHLLAKLLPAECGMEISGRPNIAQIQAFLERNIIRKDERSMKVPQIIENKSDKKGVQKNQQKEKFTYHLSRQGFPESSKLHDLLSDGYTTLHKKASPLEKIILPIKNKGSNGKTDLYIELEGPLMLPEKTKK